MENQETVRVKIKNLNLEVDHPSGTACLVRLAGELDHFNISEVFAVLDREICATSDRVVLDLERLDFMDSSGIKLLVKLLDHFGAQNVNVYGASGNIKRLFSVVAIDKRINYIDLLEFPEAEKAPKRAA